MFILSTQSDFTRPHVDVDAYALERWAICQMQLSPLSQFLTLVRSFQVAELFPACRFCNKQPLNRVVILSSPCSSCL